MPVYVPPSPNAAQVPEYARRYEKLKMRFHAEQGVGRARSGRGEKSGQAVGAVSSETCRPAPVVKVPRVRLPRRRESAREATEVRNDKNWALRSAGIAVVASLAVSVLANIVIIGLDGSSPMHAGAYLGDLLSHAGWGL